MPRKGQHTITVSDAFYKDLEADATRDGATVPQHLKTLLSRTRGYSPFARFKETVKEDAKWLFNIERFKK